MSPVKKNTTAPANSKSSRSIFAWFSGMTGTLILCTLLIGIFFACAYATWQKIGHRVLASPEYFVGPGQIEITPQPPWLSRSDLPTEIYQDLSRQGPLRIMDDDLAERVADAFSRHPWVAKVRQVRKQFPAKIKVDLVYRRPVCMVEIAGNLLPVDVEGSLLPQDDFSPVEKAKYPRLVGVDRGPMSPDRLGSRWGDSRVAGGAEIANELLPLWEEFKLQYIVPLPQHETGTGATAPAGTAQPAGECYFAVLTRGGMRILWGRSPAANPTGEPTPQQKIKKLEQIFAEHGSLDYPQGPRELDLTRP